MRENKTMKQTAALRFPVALVLALCVTAGLSSLQAQVKDWKKIKFPSMRSFTSRPRATAVVASEPSALGFE